MSIGKIFFSLSGRIPRQTYWLAHLSIVTALFIAGCIGAAIEGGHRSSGSSAIIFLLALLYLAALWCILAVSVKRWHDRGKSGLWMLIYFVPFVGPLWLLIELGFLEGTQGPNEFDEGHFARDVSLASDDPLLSAPPIAGRRCVHCQQEIVSFIGAELCTECKDPLHRDCARAHVAGAHGPPAHAAYP